MDEDLATQGDETVSMDESIAAAWKEITERETVETEPEVTDKPTRQPDGKFAAKVEATEVEPVVTDTPIEPAIKAPSSWTKEAQAEFSKLPAHVQNDVIRREGDFHKGIEGYKQAAQRAQEYDAVFQPYQANMQASGVAAPQAIKALLEADHSLRNGSEEQKTQMALQIMRDYRINPQSVFDALQSQPQADPAYTELAQRLNRFESKQAQEDAARQQREHEALNSEIVRFSQGKEHFGVLRDLMGRLMQSGAADNLDDAYQKAMRLNDSVWSAEQTKQLAAQKAEAQRKTLEAKKSAAVNVSTRGALQPKPATGSWDDTIRADAERLGLI